MTDLDDERHRAAQHVDRVLAPYVPDAVRWSLARRLVDDFLAAHWYPRGRTPGRRRPGSGDPPNDEYHAVRQAMRAPERPATPGTGVNAMDEARGASGGVQ